MGLCKYSVHTNQFYNPLWVKQDNTESMKKWRCEYVVKWFTSIEGFPDDFGITLFWNKVNGDALIVIGREDLK